MTVVEQIVCGDNRYQQQDEQDDGDGLVRLRLLHRPAIVTKRVVCRHLFKQLGIDTVIVGIELPLMQGQSRYCTLVADAENRVVVGLQAVMIPLDLWCYQRGIAHRPHLMTALWTKREIMRIQIVSTGIGKLQCALVSAVDIREIG